jgi:predicted dinucleotide-binding enzyme
LDDDGFKSCIKDFGLSHFSARVIDVTNAIGANMELAIGFTTSAAEKLQKLLPKAHVVKAFNTVFAQNQDAGKVGKEQLSAFIAGDDLKAKKTIMQLAKDIGFDPARVDSGPLKIARYIEPMAMLNITLGYGQKIGTKIGFKLIKG